jgi:flagellar biosynthesis regulator FlaF
MQTSAIVISLLSIAISIVSIFVTRRAEQIRKENLKVYEQIIKGLR